MSDLVGNPEDRFSRVEAHLNTYDELESHILHAHKKFLKLYQSVMEKKIDFSIFEHL